MRSALWQAENGLTVELYGGRPGKGRPYGFVSISSALGATAETARAPRQEGQTTYYATLDAMTVNLVGTGWLLGNRSHPARAEYDKARSFLAEAFAPDVWGTLTYYREDRAVRARCRAAATPAFTQAAETFLKFDVDLVSDDPCWWAAEEEIVCVGRSKKFFRFPWTPVLSPLGALERTARVVNPSTRTVYPTVEVYSTGQYVTLRNETTGGKVTIEHAIAGGEKLVVDLRDVTAWLWRQDGNGDYRQSEDVSHWMSLDSEPWGVVPGRNVLTIANDEPEDTPVAYIRWRLPVLGV